MKYCPITYELIEDSTQYSQRGLRLLAPALKTLAPIPLTALEQRRQAIASVDKMSIQGVQPKLSAQLKIKEGCFEIVDQQGTYILKPQSDYYPELPENEAITMSLAAIIGIEVPIHGLVYSKDGSLTYFIKRFDRLPYHQKLPTEDFSQLLNLTRDTKYNSSMEKMAELILTSHLCSFPKIEAVKFFKIVLFSFLVGNEDLHVKNLSLITRDQKTTLSPVYDLLNSTIAQIHSKEEMALLLRGKKNNLTKRDLLEYFAIERLKLSEKIILKILKEIKQAIPFWKALIARSFLSEKMQEKYLQILQERCKRLEIE
jgi:serine/threonine-protein kinase HipA